MSFTPQERVQAALAHTEPDRLPLSLWGSWYGVTDKLYFAALAQLGWQPVPPFRPDLLHSVNYYDDRLLAELGTDIRHVDPGVTAVAARVDEKGVDGWGLQWRQAGLYRAASLHPLETAQIEEIQTWPLPGPDTVQADAIRSRLQVIHQLDQEYAIAGRGVASYGFFEMAQSLRKHEQLLMDMVLNPEIVHALVSRIFACYAGLISRFLDIAGPDLDLLELPGDDFAGNKGLIISPQMFDQFFRDPYTRLIQLIKRHSPHIKVVFHSDGAIADLLPVLIEMGVDAVHPLEPLPATDMAQIKARFGHQITLMGGIDIRTTMQGGAEGIVAEVAERIAQLAAGGGYILAPANHLQGDVPAQNLFTLYQAAQELGRYEK